MTPKQVGYYRHATVIEIPVYGIMRYRANVVGRRTQSVEVALWEARGLAVWASREVPLLLTTSLPRARHLCALLNDQLDRAEMGDR